MKALPFAKTASVLAIAAMFAACSNMTHKEKDTAVGAGGGAVAGAVVGGPVGAVVGAGVGGVAGHEVGKSHEQGKSAVTGEPMPRTSSTASATPTPSTSAPSGSYSPTLIRNVQQALNDKGYNAGPADGRWGIGTESALRSFQQAQGLPASGSLDARTMSALGVS